MLGFALSTLRHRKAGFVGAFVALFCAAALVCGCGMIMETGLAGSLAPERFAGAPIMVSGDQNVHLTETNGDGKVKQKEKPHTDRAWLPAELVDRLRAVPGVGAVVPELTFPAYLPGRATDQSWGHGWESAALTPVVLGAGRAPAGPGEIVVEPSAHLPVGASVPVRTPAGIDSYRVVGVTARSLPHQSAVFFATEQARQLAGHQGQVAAIGVFPAAAAPTAEKAAEQAVEQAVAGTTARVSTGDGRGSAEFPAADEALTRLVSMGAPMGGTALLVAILAVVGTFTLSIQQRQREFALMRAVAATPKQIRTMISREVLLIGLVAAPTGALGGLGLGFWIYSELVRLGRVPAGLALVVGPFAPLAAVLATLLAGLVAARVAGRRVARIRPVEALGDAVLQPPGLAPLQLLAGLLAVAGAVVLTYVLSKLTTDAGSGPVAPLTALLWTIAVALLGPLLARAAFAVLGVPLRLLRAPGELAAANLRAGARRLASVITPLSLMVAMACTLTFTQTTLAQAVSAQARAGNTADYVVGPKAPAQVAESLRGVPGVRAVTEVLHTTVRSDLTDHSAQGVTPAGLASTLDLAVRSGSTDALGEDTMAVAEGLGISLGDQVPVTLADGTPVTLRVVATYRRGLGFGDFTMAHDLVAAHVDVPLDDAVLVSAPGLPRAALVLALRPYPGLGVLDRAQSLAEQRDSSTGAAYLGLALIIAFAAITAVNTLVMSVLGRSRELALLRLVGATRRQVMRMLGWETTTVVLLAVTVGSVVSAATLVAYSTGMTGDSTPYTPASQYLAIIGAAALLALLATALPARAALGHRPADALGARE